MGTSRERSAKTLLSPRQPARSRLQHESGWEVQYGRNGVLRFAYPDARARIFVSHCISLSPVRLPRIILWPRVL